MSPFRLAHDPHRGHRPGLPPGLLHLLLFTIAGAAACGDDPLPNTSDGGTDGSGGNDATAGDTQDNPDASADSADLPIDPACAALAAARCERTETCTMGFGIGRTYGDRATCERVHGQTCTVALGAPGSATTAPAIEACAVAFAAMSCADLLNGVQIEACAGVPGMREIAAACAVDAQCASTACDVEPGAACGTCVPRAASGASCADARCEPGLFCVPADMTCRERSGIGAPCDPGQPCAPGLDCVGALPPMGVPGTCQALLDSPGATCDPMRQTTAACDGRLGLYCHPVSGTCESSALADAGMPCGPVDGRLVACRGGASCYRPGMGPGTCVAPVEQGQPCNVDTGPICIPPAFCARTGGSPTGLCQLRDPASCG